MTIAIPLALAAIAGLLGLAVWLLIPTAKERDDRARFDAMQAGWR